MRYIVRLFFGLPWFEEPDVIAAKEYRHSRCRVPHPLDGEMEDGEMDANSFDANMSSRELAGRVDEIYAWASR
jgi:hypothetical protein